VALGLRCRFLVTPDEEFSAFVELELQVSTVTFHLESIRADECDSLPYGTEQQ
jgi:hypothetical protein